LWNSFEGETQNVTLKLTADFIRHEEDVIKQAADIRHEEVMKSGVCLKLAIYHFFSAVEEES
jgi:uncharacterized protein YjcR